MKTLKKIFTVFYFCIVLFLILNIGLYAYCYLTPKIDINKVQSYYIYDNENKLMFNHNDEWIKLKDISPYLIQATIDTEDKYFYQHLGFDYFRIFKAAIRNFSSRKLKEGASTITQQYARNLFLSYDKTWERKIDEAFLAAELEVHYTKDEILEGYLNTINYGGVYGIENASWYYFGHSANSLSLAEASILAGIPQSPSNYSPLTNLNNAKKRQRIVLNLMNKNGDINYNDIESTLEYPLSFLGKTYQSDLENILYFRDAVIDELRNIDTIPNSLIETGGLKIYTTLDKNAQKELESAVRSQMGDSNQLQVAGMMMDPNTGGVMAMVGGVNYSKSQFNRAIDAKRQVGSTMKPILYYSALENGFTSASSFISEKTTFNFSGGKQYTPSNYNDNYANSAISMGAAISYSDNIYAVKTHLFLGENSLINTAKRLGIQSTLKPIPSLALGTGEVSMIDMVEAYSSFANMGYKVKRHFIDRVEDNDGNVLYQFKDEKEMILNPSLTYILNEMLTYTYDTAFIDYNYPTVINLLPKMTHKYSIKTGTTDTDVWIIGYNKNAVMAVWNGYDDNKRLEKEDNGFHKNIWIDTMEAYLKDNHDNWYELPENVVGYMVNPITGEPFKEGDEKSKIFYFLKGTEPNYFNRNFESVFKEENEKRIAS